MTTRMDMAVFAVLLTCASFAQAADLSASLKPGTPKIEAAGPIAFAPEGILLLGDPQAAAVFAISTGDKTRSADSGQVNIEGIGDKVAAALGTQAQGVLINDLAVNPASGKIYLSVTRGSGPSAQAVLLRVDQGGAISEVSLTNVPFAKAALPNAPAESTTGRNQRRESITDLAYVDGRVIIAGLSNEEFSSKLRSIPFPFSDADAGASIEIYHGAHGRFETSSPVRTFAAYNINGEAHLLAAYTCTPLVKFPVKSLMPGQKVKGTTVAELGNRNRPLDMIVYKKDGRDYVLMSNSSRGLMKITTEGLASAASIEQKISEKAGLTYDTIAGMEGIEQLDRLNDKQAVVIVKQKDGRADLKTLDLP